MEWQVSEDIRLLSYEEVPIQALDWYQDENIQWLVNGCRRPYTKKEIKQMYDWQAAHGRLYLVAKIEGESSQLIGDVWLADDDFALMIAPSCQQQGVGSSLVQYFLAICRKEGRFAMLVQSVYSYNYASQALFEKNGFTKQISGGMIRYLYELE